MWLICLNSKFNSSYLYEFKLFYSEKKESMIPDKEEVKNLGIYINMKSRKLMYFSTPNQDGPPVVPLKRQGDKVFPCCWASKCIGARTTWVKVYKTITAKVSNHIVWCEWITQFTHLSSDERVNPIGYLLGPVHVRRGHATMRRIVLNEVRRVYEDCSKLLFAEIRAQKFLWIWSSEEDFPGAGHMISNDKVFSTLLDWGQGDRDILFAS